MLVHNNPLKKPWLKNKRGKVVNPVTPLIREKTVGSSRRSIRSFPHPHFDKPIPDPTEVDPPGSGTGGGGGQANNKRDSPHFLHLKKTFHEAVRDPQYEWELLPISNSLRKLRLENTKVKGDGASVVLECCPNLYSLGYLVFAAAGLKQVEISNF